MASAHVLYFSSLPQSFHFCLFQLVLVGSIAEHVLVLVAALVVLLVVVVDVVAVT